MADLPDFSGWSAEQITNWLKSHWPSGGTPTQTGAPASAALTGGAPVPSGAAPGGTAAPAPSSAAATLANLNSTGANTVSQPATQKWTLLDHPTPAQLKEGLALRDAAIARGESWPEALPGQVYLPPNPNYTPPAATSTSRTVTTAGNENTGWFAVEPGKNPGDPATASLIVPPHTPNADDEINKALDRFNNEKIRQQRLNNEAAGFGYADDDTVAKRSLEARAAGLDDKKFAQSKAQDDEKIRQYDITRAAQDKVDAANIGLTTANTGLATANTARTGAETTQILQNTGATAAKLPGELAQQGATLAGTQASTAATQASAAQTRQATQIAGAAKPVDSTFGTTSAKVAVTNPLTGQVTYEDNPNYQPKTLADVQARVGQIQSVMQAKQAEVQGKVGQTINGKLYTADDALKDFNNWHAQNVQPQLGALQAAQQDAAFQRAKDEAAMRTSAYNAATAAGTQAISAFGAMQNGRVGDNFDAANEAASRGDFKALAKIPGGGTGYTAPDITKTSQQSVMDALKYIDPQAAQATGRPMPNYGSVDIAGQLGAMPYWPGGGAPPAAPAPAAAAAPAAAPGVSGPAPAPAPAQDPLAWYQALRGRQAVDVAAQQRQAQVAGSPDQWAQWIPDYSLG